MPLTYAYDRARQFACDWTSCWEQIACPGLDGSDHSAICDSLTKEAQTAFAREDEACVKEALLFTCAPTPPCEHPECARAHQIAAAIRERKK